MDRSHTLAAIVSWLRTGYPNGVPHNDYVPLLALLRRQLTDDEVVEVASELASTAPEDSPINRIDAGVEISKITDEMPHDNDVQRVRSTLETAGWPFNNEPLANPESSEEP